MNPEPVIHTLVISGECDGCGATSADAKCVNGSHTFDHKITCPGISSYCRGWEECLACSGADDEARDLLMENNEAHGIEHQLIHGMWMTATDRCFIACHDNQSEAIMYLDNLGPGTYQVYGEDYDEGALELELVKP